MIEVLAARQQWCRPGEPILWCIRSHRNYLFDVEGLDEKGKPKKGWGTRAALGAGDAVGGVLGGVFDAVTGGDTDSDLKDSPPSVLFGPGPNCMAVAKLSRLPTGEDRACWVLTSHRLGLLTFHDAAEPEAGEAEESAGLLGGALKFGKGAMKFARDVRDIVASKPEYEPGVAVPVPQASAHLEIQRPAIADIGAHQRKLGRGYQTGKPWYLRVQFTDGSGIELSPSPKEKPLQRLVAMSHGKI
ncbi:hypothetical protein [Saccharopolyspora phatthalungensis]|uniref:Uncharacterized protein n=1 Tax=Saccharopolyspora phatthalungensis TaxID=664693 RepID=A0A840Q1Y9_9PSEU|nr:hypothetical protein [Saccharopolyspora phatthalungensis]MBB5152749.1 hypothetical protein [Saccharopolyspora phatthalungensis]